MAECPSFARTRARRRLLRARAGRARRGDRGAGRSRRRLRVRGEHRRGRGRRVDRPATTAPSPEPCALASGRFGQALSFDGVNDIVSVPDANSLDLTSGMTLEAWVKPSALGSAWRTAVLKERPGDLVYGLYANTNAGKPVGQAYIGGYQEIFGTSALPLDTWTHLAATFDGATQRLYVGGVQAASRAAHRRDDGVGRRAEDRRQHRLGRMVPGPDRRGSRLQPGPLRRRDPVRHEHRRRRGGCGGDSGPDPDPNAYYHSDPHRNANPDPNANSGPSRPGGGLRLQRGQRLVHRRSLRQRQYRLGARRRQLGEHRQVRQGAGVQRQQRLGQGRRQRLARSDDRHDAGGVGEAGRAVRLELRDPQGAPRDPATCPTS